MTKKCVLGLLILLVGVICSAVQADIDIAQWNFEPGALTTDSSGNGNVLTNYGVVSSSPADVPSGLSGNSAYFDAGIASCLETSGQLDLSSFNQIEISWYMKSSFSATAIIFEQSVNWYNGNGAFVVYADAGSLYAARSGATCQADGGFAGATLALPTDGAWHEYKVVFDRSLAGADHVILYCDGVAGSDFTAATYVDTPFVSEWFYIGARETFSLFYTGNIDQLLISTNEPLPAPVFSPSCTEIRGSENITMTSTIAGAQIYYTTDGTTPTLASANGPSPKNVTVTPGMTLKAMAVQGANTSDVTSATYVQAGIVINGSFEAETFAGYGYATGDGISGWIYAGANAGINPSETGFMGLANGLDIPDGDQVLFIQTGGIGTLTQSVPLEAGIEYTLSYYESVRDYSNTPHLTVELGSQELASHDVIKNVSYICRTATFTVPADDMYTLKFSSENLNDLGIADATLLLDHIQITITKAPVFTPGSKFISEPTAITMSCDTAGASIYYTTDGTTPTDASTLYTTPVVVDDGTVLKAIAIEGGLSSIVTSTTYANNEYTTIPVVACFGVPDGWASVERFQDLVDAGFTHQITPYPYETLKRAMDAFNAAYVAGIGIIAAADTSDETIVVDYTVEDFVAQVKDHPALEAYFIEDEPVPSEFADVATELQGLMSLDPNHWGYVNLNPGHSGSLGMSFEDYVDLFLATVPVEVLSFDHYPILDDEGEIVIRSNFFSDLETISAAAQGADIPFWTYLLSTAHGDYPIPTLTHLRFQIFSSLAYGSQGIQYYRYWTPLGYEDGPIDWSGNKTPIYYLAQTVNSEVAGLSPVFLNSTVQSVGHTGASIPTGTSAYVAAAPITSLATSGSDGAVVSTLVNGDDAYLVVVNRDIDSSMVLDLTVDAGRGITKVAKDGTETALTGGTVQYTVDPADIVVLKWSNVTPVLPGDANGDGAVDVGDLGILAANYGTTTGATWATGDFNGDGAVDVGDLGILAANYGSGSSSANWDADYAKVFGAEADEEADVEETVDSLCSVLGLPLIAGLALMGLMLVKFKD